jgi:aryl-alcohol dehydrogenase-like predicted oxidoreductase
MDRRVLGRTGEELSIIGFGGMLVNAEEPTEAARLVSMAVNELDINYFDVAPTYGYAEERLGPALAPYRKRIFLACKTMERSAEGATAALQRSLSLLRTDHLDLYQFHAVTTLDEVEQIMGPGGALEAYEQARRQGLIRYIGFSAHSEEAALALLDRYDFDSILFPLSWTIWHVGHFGPRVLARAQE